jgi:hypothetical protein
MILSIRFRARLTSDDCEFTPTHPAVARYHCASSTGAIRERSVSPDGDFIGRGEYNAELPGEFQGCGSYNRKVPSSAMNETLQVRGGYYHEMLGHTIAKEAECEEVYSEYKSEKPPPSSGQEVRKDLIAQSNSTNSAGMKGFRQRIEPVTMGKRGGTAAKKIEEQPDGRPLKVGSYSSYISLPTDVIDKIGRSHSGNLESEVDATIAQIHGNIDKVSERGERLDSLQKNTGNLTISAEAFRRGANRANKQSSGYWNDLVSWITSPAANLPVTTDGIHDAETTTCSEVYRGRVEGVQTTNQTISSPSVAPLDHEKPPSEPSLSIQDQDNAVGGMLQNEMRLIAAHQVRLSIEKTRAEDVDNAHGPAGSKGRSGYNTILPGAHQGCDRYNGGDGYNIRDRYKGRDCYNDGAESSIPTPITDEIRPGTPSQRRYVADRLSAISTQCEKSITIARPSVDKSKNPPGACGLRPPVDPVLPQAPLASATYVPDGTSFGPGVGLPSLVATANKERPEPGLPMPLTDTGRPRRSAAPTFGGMETDFATVPTPATIRAKDANYRWEVERDHEAEYSRDRLNGLEEMNEVDALLREWTTVF